MESLEDHRAEVHGKGYNSKKQVMQIWKCKFCEEIFQTKNVLMKHNREEHSEHLNVCWRFQKGSCYYGDSCWFLHDQHLKGTMPDFKCSFCSEIFENENDLMKHKKEMHTESVPFCRQLNSCIFGPRCWYRHDNENMNNEGINDPASNSELLKKLINMMEIFSQKIVSIEKNMN